MDNTNVIPEANKPPQNNLYFILILLDATTFKYLFVLQEKSTDNKNEQ